MTVHRSFSKLVQSGIYVDKTEEISSLISHRSVLLVRPRKFGKSVLVSSLYELFSGNRDLFRNTYLAKSGYDFKKHPVIALNLHFDVTTPGEFASCLRSQVKTLASLWGVELKKEKPDEMFDEFLRSFKEELVVLVDNYDFVLADNIRNPDIEKLDGILARFIGVLNDESRFRFVFLTGINNFLLCDEGYGQVLEYDDLTMDPSVSSICGFTEQEINSCFMEKIRNLASISYIRAHGIDELNCANYSNSRITYVYSEYLRQKQQSEEDLLKIIMTVLGGYRFSNKETNLASTGFVMDFLRGNGVFDLNYDLRCARGYIVQKLKNPLFSLGDYIGVPLDPILSCGPHYSYRPQLGALLLQNGLLTIDRVEDDDDEIECMLKIPNEEVQNFLEKRIDCRLGS